MRSTTVTTSGQSLIEAVVIVGLVVVLATGLVAGSTASLKGSQSVRDKSLAIGYTQEGIELSRRLRDGSWDQFAAYGGTTQCLSADGAWSPAGAGDSPCGVANIGAFTRTVQFAWITYGANMKVQVDVSWQEGTGKRTNTLVTYFTKWK